MLVGILLHFGYSNQPVFGKSPPSQITPHHHGETAKQINVTSHLSHLRKVLHNCPHESLTHPLEIKKKSIGFGDWNLIPHCHSQTTRGKNFQRISPWCGRREIACPQKGYLRVDIDQGLTMDSLLRDNFTPPHWMFPKIGGFPPKSSMD